MAKILSSIKLLMFISWCSDWNCGSDQKVHLHILLLPYLSLSWLLYWHLKVSYLSLFISFWSCGGRSSSVSVVRRILLPGLCKKLTGPISLKFVHFLFRCWFAALLIFFLVFSSSVRARQVLFMLHDAHLL